MSLTVEQVINNKLSQFTKLGRLAKKIQKNRKQKDLLNRVHIGMAKIAIELDVVKDVIFDQHPNLMPLFESLIELYGIDVKDKNV